MSIYATLIPEDSPPCVLDTGNPCQYDDACRFVSKLKARRSSRDCRNPEAMQDNATAYTRVDSSHTPSPQIHF